MLKRKLLKAKKLFAAAMVTVLTGTTIFAGAGLSSAFAAALDKEVAKTVDAKTDETTKVTTTVTEWDFTGNTGAKVANGDTLNGIKVYNAQGGASCRVYLDTGKDLNVKNNGGAISLPVKDDTNKVTLTVVPLDADSSRYVEVGAIGSGLKLVDDSAHPETNTVLVRDITDIAVKDADGRWLNLVSNGNFKIKKLIMVESNIATKVTVSGELKNTDNKVTAIKFKNIETGDVYTADVVDNKYTIVLPNEYTYIAAVNNNYAIDNNQKILLNKNSDKETLDFTVKYRPPALVSGNVIINKYDNAVAIDADKFAVNLIPADDTEDVVNLSLAKGDNAYSYTYADANLVPGLEYSVELIGANDYQVTDKIKVAEAKPATFDIKADKKPVYKVTGNAVTSTGKDVTISSVTFTNMKEAGYSYTFGFETPGKSFVVELRDGEYEMTANTNSLGYGVYDHVSVKGAAVTEDVYLYPLDKVVYDLPTEVNNSGSALKFTGVKRNNSTSVSGKAGATIEVPVSGKQKVTVTGWYSGTVDINGKNEVTFNKTDNPNATSCGSTSYETDGTETSVTINFKGSATVYLYQIVVERVVAKNPYKEVVEVGSGKEFKTVTDAINYIANMDRTDSQRVTVKLTDKLYREQIIINTPNVTFESALKEGSILTWYYGLGYQYYSVGDDQMYNEARAVDKYYKKNVTQSPGNWGATVSLKSGATGFKAKNVIFENSFNRYVTEEELADGVENISGYETKYDRTQESADVRLRAAKERACAMYNRGANNIEFDSCKFISTQDTIYTGDKDEDSYYVNCFIEGNTDYICGDGNPVFDGCTLSMYGYTDQKATGSYIAASKKLGTKGYLFNRCRIISTPDEGIQPISDTYLARAWAAGIVHFMNTIVESDTTVIPVAYKDMNEKVKDAKYYEYNTHTPDGIAVDTSSRAEGVTIMTDAEADKIKVADWFTEWVPTYLRADYTKLEAALVEYNKLVLDRYKDVKELEAAIAAVDNNLKPADQAKVDAMATAILDAIDNLEIEVKEPAIEAEVEGNAPATTVDTPMSELEDKVLTEADRNSIAFGDKVVLLVKVSDLTDTITDDDKKAIEGVLAATGKQMVVGQYIDISVIKKIGENEQRVTDTKGGKIKLSITIPDSMINTDAKINRTYMIARIHDGKVDLLSGSFDKDTKKFTFESDKFSTYAIVYVDAEAGTSVEPGPGTGDSTPIALYIILALISMVVLAGAVVYSKKKA